jgi:hypothetical protein
MAVAYSGLHIQGAQLVHAGPVYLTGYLIAHAQITTQAVLFRDGLDGTAPVKLWVRVAPQQSPATLMLDREQAVRFEAGLWVEGAAGVEVHVWAVGR